MDGTSDQTPAPTIYDVATRAGVSIATVSRVLNGHTSIRPETRNRVMVAVRDLKFVPNQSARGLSSGNKKVIGLVFARVPSEDDLSELEEETLLFTDSVIRGAELAAQRRGYSLLLHGTSGERADRAVAELTGKTDGLILTDRVLPERRASSFARQFPIVLLAGSGRSRSAMTVRADNWSGMQAMAEHLVLVHGMRRLAYLSGAALSPDSVTRGEAFRVTAERLGATVEPEGDWHGDWTSAGAARVVQQRLASGAPLPDAIACASDSSAVGAQHALAAAGVRVPDDIAVTGFDDIAMARHLLPALTTVHQPIQQLGAVAVETLLIRVSGDRLARRDIVLPTSLRVRASCGCAPQDMASLTPWESDPTAVTGEVA